jgi:hypothetical protein
MSIRATVRQGCIALHTGESYPPLGPTEGAHCDPNPVRGIYGASPAASIGSSGGFSR